MRSSTIPRRRSSAPNHSAHSGNTGRPKRTASRCKMNSEYRHTAPFVAPRCWRQALSQKTLSKEARRAVQGVCAQESARTFCKSQVFRPAFRRTRALNRHPKAKRFMRRRQNSANVLVTAEDRDQVKRSLRLRSPAAQPQGSSGPTVMFVIVSLVWRTKVSLPIRRCAFCIALRPFWKAPRRLLRNKAIRPSA